MQEEDLAAETNLQFLNALRDGVIVADTDGVITFVNHVASRLLGLGQDLLIGKQLRDSLIIQTELGQSANVDTLLVIPTLQDKKSIVINQKTSGQLSLVRRDRSQFPASMQTLPYPMTQVGEGMTLVFYDISAEEKIEQSKSEFVSLISHQLRTPINITSWYTEKLLSQRKGDLNDKQKGYLKEIDVSNKRIIDLVSAIVNVSRTDLARLKSKLEKVYLTAVVDDQIKQTKSLAASKSVIVEPKYIPNDRLLEASDREYIEVILHTILNNAIKYTYNESIIEVSITSVEAGSILDLRTGFKARKSGYVVSIKDHGLGIPDEQKDQVFSKLFRADNVKALDVTGLGLGLYIAQSFAESVDGHLWFESRISIGSVFHLFLPLD